MDLLSRFYVYKEKTIDFVSTVLVEEGGFEPPKAMPADLQSAPFSHLGTPPCILRSHSLFPATIHNYST